MPPHSYLQATLWAIGEIGRLADLANAIKVVAQTASPLSSLPLPKATANSISPRFLSSFSSFGYFWLAYLLNKLKIEEKIELFRAFSKDKNKKNQKEIK